ncbi:F-box protein At5g03100-like [Bidens hawaiensis]|uniref:F-box protein At5g03100-like n=1 Tax=Bidens hawaiensis TaxID=980011 RepID=UPI00404B7DC6
MAQRKSKKIRRKASKALNDDDRLSRLPDGLIHHIFSFMDTRYAIQSSVLSRNWRDTWKSQPQLSTEIIRSPNRASGSKFPDFVHKFLSRRDAVAELSTIAFQSNFIGLPLLREIIVYAMSHKTRMLKIEFSGDMKTRRAELDASLFRSQHLEQLFLSIKFNLILSPPLTMDFPALTTLNINRAKFRLNDDTPKLSSFTYKGLAKFLLSAKDLVSLKTVCFQTIKEPEVTDWISTFSQLYRTESLTLNFNVLKGLSEFPELLKTQNCPFTSLQTLTLLSRQFPLSLAAFNGVLNYFSRSSPDLKIHIEHDPIPPHLLFSW